MKQFLDLKKSCKTVTESSFVCFTQLPVMLRSYHEPQDIYQNQEINIGAILLTVPWPYLNFISYHTSVLFWSKPDVGSSIAFSYPVCWFIHLPTCIFTTSYLSPGPEAKTSTSSYISTPAPLHTETKSHWIVKAGLHLNRTKCWHCLCALLSLYSPLLSLF